MFEVEKMFHVEAGHTLDHHDGKCRSPHGHSYIIKVKLRTAELIPNGPKKHMVMDFLTLSDIVKPMIAQYFDHKWLNDSLQTDTPTAEFIAYWIFCYLQPFLPNLYSVTVCETASSQATYSKD